MSEARMGPIRERAVTPATKAAVHDSTQDNAGSGQRTTRSTKTDATKAKQIGESRGPSAGVKGAAGRKTGGHQTATSNSEEVRVATQSTGSGRSTPLQPEEEDTSSDVSEVIEEEVVISTACKRRGRERQRSTSQNGGEQNEDRIMRCSPQPHEQASSRFADRRMVMNASGEDSLIVAANDYNPVSSRSGRSDRFSGGDGSREEPTPITHD